MAGGDAGLGPGSGPRSPWRAVRYSMLTNLQGPSGMLVGRTCGVFELRVVAYTAAALAFFYDATNTPTNLMAVGSPSLGNPDYFPRKGVRLEAQRGVYVSFSMGTGGIAATVWYDRD